MELLQSLRHLHGSGEAAYHQQLTSTSLTSSSSSRSNNTARTADAVQAGAAGMIDSAPLRVGPSRGRGRATAAPHAVFILDDDGPQSSKEGTEMASRSTNYTFLTASCSSELSTGSGVEERADKCGAGTTKRCSVQRGHRGAASVVAPPLRMAPRSPWPSRVPTPILTAPTRRRTTSSTASMRAYSAHAEEDDGTADIQELARADEQMKSRNNIKLGRDESARRHPGKGHDASGETNDTNNLPQFARGFSGLTRSSALVSESPLLSRAGTSFLSPPSLTEPATSTASSPRHHATRGASGRATSRPGDWTTPAIELLAHEAQEGAWRETFDAECSVERQTELVQLRRQVKEMEVELKFAHQTELQNGNRSEAIAPAEDVGKEDGQDDAYIHLLEEVVQHYRDEVVALRHETSDLRDALERRRSQLSECRQLYGSTVRCLLQDRHDLEQQRAVVVNELEEMASMLTTARAAERAALRRGMEIGPAMCDATSKGSFTPISTTLSYTFNGRDGAVVQGAIPSLQSSLAEPSTPAPLTHLETARPAFSTHGLAHCRSVSGGSSSGAWSPPKLPTPSSSLSVPNVYAGVRGGGGLSSPWASHARARAAASGVIEVGHAIDEHADPQSSGPMLLNPDPPSHESLEEAQLRMRVEQLKQRNQELVDLLKNALKSLSELASCDMSDDDDDELSPRTRAW